jgi:hypothetical protein
MNGLHFPALPFNLPVVEPPGGGAVPVHRAPSFCTLRAKNLTLGQGPDFKYFSQSVGKRRVTESRKLSRVAQNGCAYRVTKVDFTNL